MPTASSLAGSYTSKNRIQRNYQCLLQNLVVNSEHDSQSVWRVKRLIIKANVQSRVLEQITSNGHSMCVRREGGGSLMVDTSTIRSILSTSYLIGHFPAEQGQMETEKP